MHFENFLFSEGNFTGYLDFDLSQKNIRIFDLCYFLAGLLAEEGDTAFTKEEWLRAVKAALEGYESVSGLTAEEKRAVPWVMEAIEILFAAFFIGLKDSRGAEEACRILHFVQDCEAGLKGIAG